MQAQIFRFERLDSTMVRAAQMAGEGTPDGTVIVAEEQTAGQGRFGRSWHSEPGAGLYFTQIRRPKLDPVRLPVATLALGLAVSSAIAQTSGIAVDLRWPNDVLIGMKKCAGILAQLSEGVLLIGVGINVNHTTFPADLIPIATSLSIASGRQYDRETLLLNILDAMNREMSILIEQGPEPVIRAFTAASSYVRGRRVVVEDGHSVIRGTTDGLDEVGFLWLRHDNGTSTRILAGGVRPDPCF